jgi:alkylhydroperoxidase family enzyme
MARLAFIKPPVETLAGSPAPKSGPDPDRSPDNFVRLLANSPAALEAWRSSEAALARGHLTELQRVKIGLTVAEIFGCPYALSLQHDRARRAGLTDDEIKRARRATDTDPITRAILQFTLTVTLQRGELSESDFRALRRIGITDAQIVEVVANISHHIFLSFFNTTARTDVDYPLLQPGAESPVAPTGPPPPMPA